MSGYDEIWAEAARLEDAVRRDYPPAVAQAAMEGSAEDAVAAGASEADLRALEGWFTQTATGRASYRAALDRFSPMPA